MSQLRNERGGIVLYDAFDKPQKLIELADHVKNQSDVPQWLIVREVNAALPKIFDNTPTAAVNTIIFLRVVSNLMRKPQIHSALKIGQWSALDATLAETLPKFNDKNSLYCYVPHRPVGKFTHVNFICTEVDGGRDEYFLPQDKFDTVIFSEPVTPPLEVLLAAKDFGKIYFTAPPSNVENLLKTHARPFYLEKNFALIELEMVPPLKRELRRRTPQAQLDAKKSAIIQVIKKFSAVTKKFNTLPQHEQNACLDEYIAELTRAEKILNEIFPALHSDTLKLNFNMFKEFLIDIRLYDEPQLKQLAIDDLNRQLQILAQDLNRL